MADPHTHAGTIDDPIPQRLLYKKKDGKVYTVASSNTGGGNVDIKDANESTKGVNKLSDSITSTADAATGVTAATPLAVKYVNDKVTAVEEKNTEQDTLLQQHGSSLTDHEGRIDALEAGGSGGGMSYVVTPKVLTPANGAVGQNSPITVTGSGYENVFPSDLRKHRIFELSTTQDFSTKLETKEDDADSITFDTRLEAQTKYYVRIKDVSNKEYRSNWSPVVEFTTGDVTHINTPTLTLKGYADSPTDIGSGLTVEGSAYTVSDGQSDTHKATSWSIRTRTGRSNVWESLNDTSNLTSITVPKGTLQQSTEYVVSVVYHSTNFNDSSPAEAEFTTSADFGTVQPPVITVTGEPSYVKETPVVRGGVFSNSRDPDTHAQTEFKVFKSEDMSVVWSFTSPTGITSKSIPKGKLQVSTQYKVKMRYKGTTLGWSKWAEKDFTTAAEFTNYNYIGVPGTSTFGVGLAPEAAYKSVKLEPADKCTDKNDFQYGLYFRNGEGTSVVAMKWIPKFYIAMLQKDDGTVNLSDSELDELLPYVDVTKDQMKEAQRRSPHNAMVVAPADRFADEAEANQHGFGLMRGFVDGGKEQDGFFIANTLSTYEAILTSSHSRKRYSEYAVYVRLGSLELSNDTTGSWRSVISAGSPIKSHHSSSISSSRWYYFVPAGIFTEPNANIPKENFVTLLSSSEYQCCSIFAWAIISVISLIQGQYADSQSHCAWYDSNLRINFPKGINSIKSDVDDPAVVPPDSNTYTNVFVTSGYKKTTHNGSITGITNVNGWYNQFVIGAVTNTTRLLKRSESIHNLTVNELETESSSKYDVKTLSSNKDWGGDKSSFPSLTGEFKDYFGIISFSNNNTPNSNEFGLDDVDLALGSNAGVACGGLYDAGASGGIFNRSGVVWGDTTFDGSFRAMAYPRV